MIVYDIHDWYPSSSFDIHDRYPSSPCFCAGTVSRECYSSAHLNLSCASSLLTFSTSSSSFHELTLLLTESFCLYLSLNSTVISLHVHADSASPPSFCSMCLNHLNLTRRILSSMLTKPNLANPSLSVTHLLLHPLQTLHLHSPSLTTAIHYRLYNTG